jgi:hypothetical protein
MLVWESHWKGKRGSLSAYEKKILKFRLEKWLLKMWTGLTRVSIRCNISMILSDFELRIGWTSTTVQIMELFWNFREATQYNRKAFRSKCPTSGPRFEYEPSRVSTKILNITPWLKHHRVGIEHTWIFLFDNWAVDRCSCAFEIIFYLVFESVIEIQ